VSYNYAAWREARDQGSFAAWLNERMAEAFISSSYLARCLGCSRPCVNIWRGNRGFPDRQSRKLIAAFFEVGVAELPGLPPLSEPPPEPAKPELHGIVFR